MENTDKIESFEVTYENEKYNIADFLNRHPGGTEVLLSYKDKDITKAFKHIGHSEGAVRILKKRLIKKDGDAAAPEETATATEEETNANVKIDKNFIVKKLFTDEDKFNTHKTLGFLSLLSYVYRYFWVLPTTGSLGINGDWFCYVTLLLHTLLSCSSLIFHVLRYRIKDNPLIIYEEYRLHAILFTVKGIIACLYGLHQEKIPETIRTPLLVFLMLGSHVVADLITHYFGKKGVTAVRNEDKSSGVIKFGMRSYAYYQILAQGCFLKLDPLQADLAFNTLIAIQSSAFLMTLKRKNLIDWPVHAAGYSICLILSSGYIWYAKGSVFVFYVSIIYMARIQLRMNKYLLWIIFCILYNTVL